MIENGLFIRVGPIGLTQNVVTMFDICLDNCNLKKYLLLSRLIDGMQQ